MKQSLSPPPPIPLCKWKFPLHKKKNFYKEFYGNTGSSPLAIWCSHDLIQNSMFAEFSTNAWNKESIEWCIHHDITIHNKYFQHVQLHGLISTGTLKIVECLSHYKKNYISNIQAIGRDVTARRHLWNIILVIFYFYFKYM